MQKQLFKWVFILTWFLFTAGLIASLHASHLVQWQPDPTLVSRSQTEAEMWSIHHVLASDCKCSLLIVQHLLKRGPQSDLLETVTWIGAVDENSEALQKRGFRVAVISPETIRKDLPAGVPFMAIHTPQKQGVYLGGYADEALKKETAIKDLEILAHFREGRSIASLPIYGCTISQKFRNQIDPFSLKYRKAGL